MSPRTDEPPLSLPYYGAPASAALRRFFAKYATFRGRASRAEYWWMVLAGTILTVLLRLLDGSQSGFELVLAPFRNAAAYETGWVAVLAGIISLATLIPSLALIWRRLHDVNRSGLWILAVFIPIAGVVFLVILFLLPSLPAGRRFD
ncbi:DUF805 domain-containing protein [Rathayibacter sp. VKM Ac-2803]|uniref:DUF805 domain-containing protein n=1 Tax=Rathayibacter sp. VKM Ac-2803 TaxID=2609256 RepID=UPI00135A38E2|nr:DUF805 domain-containing protein [Rathayibacter sp. VKM Ac-2803]MWV48096.1 DUF805 domain-containing protein [Rathayibacter sp. VKM Ac-2803]